MSSVRLLTPALLDELTTRLAAPRALRPPDLPSLGELVAVWIAALDHVATGDCRARRVTACGAGSGMATAGSIAFAAWRT